MDNVISSAKTDMFRIRMNPEIREELEQIYVSTPFLHKSAPILHEFQDSCEYGTYLFLQKK